MTNRESYPNHPQYHPEAQTLARHKRDGQFGPNTVHIFEVSDPGSDYEMLRIDGPVLIRTGGGGIVCEQWAAHPDGYKTPGYGETEGIEGFGDTIDTYLHREDGPALIQRMTGENGPTVETWFRNCQEYHPTAHERMEWERKKIAQGGTPFHADTFQALAGKDPSMGAQEEEWDELRTDKDGQKRYLTVESWATDRQNQTGPHPAGVKEAAATAKAKATDLKQKAHTGDER